MLARRMIFPLSRHLHPDYLGELRSYVIFDRVISPTKPIPVPSSSSKSIFPALYFGFFFWFFGSFLWFLLSPRFFSKFIIGMPTLACLSIPRWPVIWGIFGALHCSSEILFPEARRVLIIRLLAVSFSLFSQIFFLVRSPSLGRRVTGRN